jgi:hypothetical protein
MATGGLTLADIRIDVDGTEYDGDDLARFFLSGGPDDLSCALRGLASSKVVIKREREDLIAALRSESERREKDRR